VLPNIVILYADDLGYGDVGCYGGTGVPTPHLDGLAREGLRFTQGYATAATCTPSRYSLLTGSYPWRNPRAHILAGDAPLIIPPGAPTLPGLLRLAGYATGVVGKWHLGLGDGALDWNAEITPGPLDVGFGQAFIMPGTNDRVPCVYARGRRVEGLDPADPIEVTYDAARRFPGIRTGKENPEALRLRASHGHDMSIVNGIGRIGFMRGGAAVLWRDEEMAEVFLREAVSFATRHRERPFFLYYALHQPHVPRLPGPRFAGTTRLGPRGDVIAEMDWCVGELLAALGRLGLASNTLVVFSSDNGPVLDDGYQDRAVELAGNHRPAGPLRGGKYSLYDGGTRVPLILRWPGTIQPGESAALVSHVDFAASFAALAGVDLPGEAAPDSLDLLPTLLGRSPLGRQDLVTEGIGAKTIMRRGDWVFIPPYPGEAVSRHTGIELGNSREPQLYDLGADLGERTNQAAARPDLVAALGARLCEVRSSQRTRLLRQI
jgi:arylsulfatase A-like enzyme